MTRRPALREIDVPLPSAAPTPPHERLTLVPSTGVDIYRSFADAAEEQRSGPVWRHQVRRVPGGLVHAAELHGASSLCGLPLDSLHEFGRSRYPFERFDETRRCPVCHIAAGRPTA
jgi:hypothetical protein